VFIVLKLDMPASRIGRIHHPILESACLVLLARFAHSHRRSPYLIWRIGWVVSSSSRTGKGRKFSSFVVIILVGWVGGYRAEVVEREVIPMQCYTHCKQGDYTEQIEWMRWRRGLVLFCIDCPCTLFLLPAIRPTNQPTIRGMGSFYRWLYIYT